MSEESSAEPAAGSGERQPVSQEDAAKAEAMKNKANEFFKCESPSCTTAVGLGLNCSCPHLCLHLVYHVHFAIMYDRNFAFLCNSFTVSCDGATDLCMIT